MEQVTIKKIEVIEPQQGKFGPQQRIKFQSEDGRWISGWVSDKRYNASEWVDGNTLELVIEQNGKYTNFKMPSAKTREAAKANEEIMEALRKLYKKVDDVEKKLDIALKPEGKSSNEPPMFDDDTVF